MNFNKNFSDKINNLPLVVISTFGHNGIDWLNSLLDSHSQIIIMPGFSFYRTYDYLNINPSMSNEKIAEIISHTFRFDKSYQVKRRKVLFNNDEKNIFYSNLLSYLNNNNNNNFDKKIFIGIHYAFAICFHQDELKNKKLIVIQEHVPWHCERYRKFFNPKYVFMMRDPRAAIAGSWRRNGMANTSKKVNAYQYDHTMLYWQYSNSFVNKYSLIDKNLIYILKNEDIHKDHLYEMKNLSKWLNVAFSETMMVQTFHGKKWGGESAYIEEDEKFNCSQEEFYNKDAIEKRWRNEISRDGIITIEVIFDRLMNKYSYKKDTQNNLIKKINGYFNYFSYSYKMPTYQAIKILSPFIELLRISRNILRRFSILFFPLKVPRFFDIP
jgi:hypothetical protein